MLVHGKGVGFVVQDTALSMKFHLFHFFAHLCDLSASALESCPRVFVHGEQKQPFVYFVSFVVRPPHSLQRAGGFVFLDPHTGAVYSQ
jgi:hypothetical protein